MYYTYDLESPASIISLLAERIKKRRLEKGLSREALSQLSGVPVPTIAKFEQKNTISLKSFISLAMSLGYTDDMKQLLCEPKFSTMNELQQINNNQNRKRGGKLK